MTTIAEHMKDILIEKGYPSVSFGDLNIIHECAKRAGVYDRAKSTTGRHPLNIISKVMNALDRSPLFIKGYVHWNNGKLVRHFSLK